MAVALEPTPSPADLDLIGGKYRIPPYRMEEIVLLLLAVASDAEILSDLRVPSGCAYTDTTLLPGTSAVVGMIADQLDAAQSGRPNVAATSGR